MLPTFTPGHISQIVGLADLQRNTLQVKVTIDNPDKRMRPDVLCRVEFWSGKEEGKVANKGDVGSARHSLWLSKDAFADSAGPDLNVWVVDPLTLRVTHRSISLSQEYRDEYRRVAKGLRANEKIVTFGAHNLSEGCRVRIVNERGAE